VAHVGEKICAYRVLIVKFEGKRSLGRSRHRREDAVVFTGCASLHREY
jgi:hypothetical protein